MAKQGPSTFQDRLHRIEGQIRGIEKQIENNAETTQVLIQIESVLSSLNSLKIEIVKKEVRESVLKSIENSISLIK